MCVVIMVGMLYLCVIMFEWLRGLLMFVIIVFVDENNGVYVGVVVIVIKIFLG